MIPRYESVQALNTQHVMFAVETSPDAFVDSKEHSIHCHLNDNHDPFQISISQANKHWNEKKGANELNKKLKEGFTQVILNLRKIVSFKEDQQAGRLFPRLSYLRLNESLLQTHLAIF